MMRHDPILGGASRPAFDALLDTIANTEFDVDAERHRKIDVLERRLFRLRERYDSAEHWIDLGGEA